MKRMLMAYGLVLWSLIQAGYAADGDRAADHVALRELRDKVQGAINAGDMKALGGCMADSFTFITSDQVVITNQAGMVAYWTARCNSPDSPVKAMKTSFTAGVLTQFLAADVGYCRGASFDVYTLRNDRKVGITNTWSAILVKQGAEWKVKEAHLGVDFLDNPVLAARELSWFGRLCVWMHLRKLPGEVTE